MSKIKIAILFQLNGFKTVHRAYVDGIHWLVTLVLVAKVWKDPIDK